MKKLLKITVIVIVITLILTYSIPAVIGIDVVIEMIMEKNFEEATLCGFISVPAYILVIVCGVNFFLLEESHFKK